MSSSVGLRELRQRASEVVHRAEAGEEITVTVSGRPSAMIVPMSRRHRWLSYEEYSDLFDGSSDPTWEADRDLIDQEIRNPWDDA